MFARKRNEVDDDVEKVAKNGFARSDARHNGNEFARADEGLDPCHFVFFGKVAFLEEFFHEGFVTSGCRFGQFGVGAFRFACKVAGNGDLFAVYVVRFVCQNVHITRHVRAAHDRNFDFRHFRAVFSFDCFNRRGEAAVFFINTVDEQDHGDLVFAAIVDGFFRADAERTGRLGHYDRTVCNGKRTHHFPFKVEKSGRVDKVDLIIFIIRVAERERNAHLSCDLFRVEVADRRAVVHFAETSDPLGRKQNRFQ